MDPVRAVGGVGWTGLRADLHGRASGATWSSFYGGRGARYGTMSIVGILVVARHPRRASTTSASGRTSAGTSPRIRSTACRTRPSRSCKGLDAPVKITVYDQETDFDRFRDRLDEYGYQLRQQGHVEYVDADKNPARAEAAQVQTLRHDRHRVQGQDRARHRTPTNRTSPTAHQGGDRRAAEDLLHPGPRRKGHRRARIDSGMRRSASALARDNYGVEQARAGAAAEVPADATAVVVAGPRTDFLQPEIDALKKYVARAGR